MSASGRAGGPPARGFGTPEGTGSGGEARSAGAGSAPGVGSASKETATAGGVSPVRGALPGEAVFSVEGASFTYPGAERPALRDVTLRIAGGTHTVVLGPNGAGKSTLLRLLLGLRAPDAGRVRFRDRDASGWSRREFARQVGVVTQEPPPDLPLTVREAVTMGRHPYLRPWAGPRAEDRAAVAFALARTDLRERADRRISDLSGGELQRVKLARALAQEPRVLVLDEPTAHLDLGHAMRIFELVGTLVREGLTAVSVTHDLHLAGRYGGSLVLLAGGRVTASGRPEAVFTADTLEAAFGWPVRVEDLGPLGRQVIPLEGP